jgi:hypothetical protein
MALDSELTLAAYITIILYLALCPLRRPKHCFRRSFTCVLITATNTSMAQHTMPFDACSQSRTPQHASLHVPAASRLQRITPILRNLHWLPIQKRIQFKLAVLIFKSLSLQFVRTIAEAPVSSPHYDIDHRLLIVVFALLFEE